MNPAIGIIIAPMIVISLCLIWVVFYGVMAVLHSDDTWEEDE